MTTARIDLDGRTVWRLPRSVKVALFALGVLIGALLGASVALGARTAPPWHLRPAQIHQWNRVHVCEGDPWTDREWGGLGIAPGTWSTFRLRGMPTHAYLATPRAQIRVGWEVVHHFHMATPDQDGRCRAW